MIFCYSINTYSAKHWLTVDPLNFSSTIFWKLPLQYPIVCVCGKPLQWHSPSSSWLHWTAVRLCSKHWRPRRSRQRPAKRSRTGSWLSGHLHCCSVYSLKLVKLVILAKCTSECQNTERQRLTWRREACQRGIRWSSGSGLHGAGCTCRSAAEKSSTHKRHALILLDKIQRAISMTLEVYFSDTLHLISPVTPSAPPLPCLSLAYWHGSAAESFSWTFFQPMCTWNLAKQTPKACRG